jgi:hypothetical protein
MTESAIPRKTHYIRSRQASAFFKAAKHAEGHARPLNLFVTVNLTHTACPSHLADKAVRAVCSKFSRWLRYQSQKAIGSGRSGYGPPTYGRVIEAPDDLHHVHWLIHVPANLRPAFEKVLPKWVLKATGGITRPKGLIDIQEVNAVMAVSRYCMKGVDPHHAKRCFVRPKPQGIVLGKRVAISRSLGAAARKAVAPEKAVRLPAVASKPPVVGSVAGHSPLHAWPAGLRPASSRMPPPAMEAGIFDGPLF